LFSGNKVTVLFVKSVEDSEFWRNKKIELNKVI